MINPVRVIFAVPLIAAVNGILMGLGNRAYEVMSGNYSVIEWPGSFQVLFWYTAIFATIAGTILAPVMVWVGTKIPNPKVAYLIVIGVVFGPIPLLLLEGGRLEGWTTLLTFSSLGAVSATLWWILVEKHRFGTESEHV